tara:strand:+ start:260 stop:472 length:213 start_codon:yes stop_codon:yes gene_type:complete
VYPAKEKGMTRKHFKMIADVVKNIDDPNVRHAVAMDFAQRLKAENPRFDISRFVGACESYATAGSVEVQF